MPNYKKAHKKDRTYQIWQEGYQPKLIQTDVMMIKEAMLMRLFIGDIVVLEIMRE